MKDIILFNLSLPDALFIVSLEKIIVFLLGKRFLTSSAIFSTPGPLNTNSQTFPFLQSLFNFELYPQ